MGCTAEAMVLTNSGYQVSMSTERALAHLGRMPELHRGQSVVVRQPNHGRAAAKAWSCSGKRVLMPHFFSPRFVFRSVFSTAMYRDALGSDTCAARPGKETGPAFVCFMQMKMCYVPRMDGVKRGDAEDVEVSRCSVPRMLHSEGAALRSCSVP